jgi:hypothetical protein
MSMEVEQNEQINLTSSLSKRLLYLHTVSVYLYFLSFQNSTFVTDKSDQNPYADPHRVKTNGDPQHRFPLQLANSCRLLRGIDVNETGSCF